MSTAGRSGRHTGLLGLGVVLYAVSVVFTLLGRDVATDPILTEVVWPLMFLAMSAIGLLIVSKHPGHSVGWLLTASSLIMLAFAAAGRAYAIYGLANPDLPLVAVVAWLGFWGWMPGMTLLTLAIFLFPTGRPPTPRWRLVVIAMIVQVVAVVVAATLLLPRWEPAHVEAATPGDLPGGAVLDWVGNLGLPPLLLAACIGLAVRYRRSRGVERLQLKWLVFAVTLLALVTVSPVAVAMDDPMGNPAYLLGLQVAMAAIPLSMAIAILRYRLYDIDRVISRTLSYALLTAALVGVYAAGVLGVGALVPGEPSDLLVAGSTLAVAALFRPLRSRIQAAVDRRFNRARYDAARTVEVFGARLRDEVDLGALAADLRAVVGGTISPAGVSVWLGSIGRSTGDR